MSDQSIGDAVVSVIIGALLGYVTGGIYNLINDRHWSGKIKVSPTLRK